MRQLFECCNRIEIHRIARIGLIRTDAALTEDDVLISARRNVLRCIQPLTDRRREPAFEKHGLLCLAECLEHLEVLHIARTNLQEIGILRDKTDIILVHDFRHNTQTCLVSDIAQNLQPLLTEPLKVVRARTWLECAAAEELRTCRFHLDRDIIDLIVALDRTRSRHNRQLLTADGETRHIDNTALGVKLAADQLILLRDAHRLFDALHHVHLEPCYHLLIPDDPDDDAILSL